MSDSSATQAAAARGRPHARAGAKASRANRAATIELRALGHADLDSLHTWLRDAEVARWYSSGAPTRAAVRRKYVPRIEGRSPTRCFVVRVDGRDAGLAQTYRISEYPAHARALDAEPGWAGLDYFLGEPAVRGRGLAHRVVETFVAEVVAAMPGVRVCASLPAYDNVRSIRALERAGFTALKRIELTPGQIDVLMTRELGTSPDTRA